MAFQDPKIMGKVMKGFEGGTDIHDMENIGKRPHIRWLANIGITYDTPPAKVQKAVQIIEDILKDHEGMDPNFPPRVYFNGFNDWSLNIMVIAWYHPPNYWD